MIVNADIEVSKTALSCATVSACGVKLYPSPERLSLKIWLLIILLICLTALVACSNSNDDTSPLDGGDNPFVNPNPNAATVVARLGYPAVRDITDDLVSTSYLSLYYDIDASITNLLRGSLSSSDVSIACPGGGSASGINTFDSFDVEFDRCVIDGRTLTGKLARDADFTVFGLGDSQFVTVIFDDFRIEAGDSGTLTLSGQSTRDDLSSANTNCSGAPRIVRRSENILDSAHLDFPNGETFIKSASWQQTWEQSVIRTNPDFKIPCQSLERLSFTGAANVVSTSFGTVNVALLGKAGNIVRDDAGVESAAQALLEADFTDGSTLAVTLTSDDDNEAQVDIVADSASVSFTATYRFEARQDIPPVLGD